MEDDTIYFDFEQYRCVSKGKDHKPHLRCTKMPEIEDHIDLEQFRFQKLKADNLMLSKPVHRPRSQEHVKLMKQTKNQHFRNPRTTHFSKHMRYVYSASKRKKNFELTNKQTRVLFSAPCYYCNSHATSTALNGIDRMDNNKGYTAANCVACCSTCNFMKGTLKVDKFLTYCKYITLHHQRS